MNNPSRRRQIFVIVFIAAIVVGIIFLSQQRYPLELFEPSVFAQAAEIGEKTYNVPDAELASAPVIVFGVAPSQERHVEIVSGFIEAAREHGKPITLVFKEVGLTAPQVPQGVQVIDFRFSDSTLDLARSLREYTQSGQRVLLYTANVLSSHLVDSNPIHRFESDWGKPVPSISTVDVSLRDDPTFKSDPVCMGSERDGSGTAALGCAAVLKGRQYYRRGIDDSKIVALMDRRGTADLLLYVSLPKSKN